jgi:hypothetical protein
VLDNASLRFVRCTDGRPVGLGGIDVKVADRDRVLKAARDRDCYRSDDLAYICGMRIGLV